MSAQTIRVLLVEDNPGDARFVREMVRGSPDLDIHHVDRLAAGLEHLATHDTDVVLLDLGLPDSQGLETLRAVLASGCAAPVVVLTGRDDEAVGRAAVREGAQDYLVKGRVAEYALTRALRYAIERNLAEESLAQSERKYRALFEDAGDAIFITDAKTAIILDVNKRAEKLMAMPRQEIIGLNRADLHPKTEEFAAEFLRHVEAGRVTDAESMVVDGKGRHIPVRINTTTFDLGGRKVIQGVFRDTSSSKRTERDLRASETRYRRLFEAAKDGILILDAESGEIVDVNPFLVELTGYSHEELLGKHLWEIGSFMDIAASKESFAELQTEKYVRYDDLPLKTRDGRKIAVEFVSNVYLADDKKIIQCNIRDITERKRAEEKLALSFETEAALNALLNLSLEGGTVDEFLERALDLLLSLEWLAVESKGAIFLIEEAGKTLRLHVHKNFPEDVLAACSTVPFGRCLCGRAADERAVVFADRVDELHDVRYPGIQPHGHYCVPILSGDHLLGVINLYVKEGHVRSAWEECFLKAVANTLSGAIERDTAKEQIASQVLELQRWQEVMLGREDRVQELKREVNECRRRAGEPAIYLSQEAFPAGSETAKAGK